MSNPCWSPSGRRLAWVDAYDGRADLVVAPADLAGSHGGGPAGVVTAECGVAGGYAWVDDDTLVVAGADGRLVLVGAEGGVERVLTHDGRALAPAVSARGEIACAIERDDACDVATVGLDGTGWPERVSHADYAWDPAWSPDGGTLVWQEWDLPNMPWHGSRIMRRDGVDAKPFVVDDAGACSQPRFSPDGARLAWVRDGALIVDGEPLLPGDTQQECAEPGWSAGQRSFAWSPAGDELAWCRNESGFGRLVIGAPGRKSARELARGLAPRALVGRSGDRVCPFRGGHARAGGRARSERLGSPAGRARGRRRFRTHRPRRAPARHVEVGRRGGARAAVASGRRARDALPMVVQIHGGPTGQALADWNPRVQWLVQQGYAVLQPNYRGSSGYGVAYRNALDGRWGDVDVADVAAGIKHGLKEGWAAPGRVALMGGSAGAFTALNVAARHLELVAAVIALYPVTDLLDLAATTHRFESGDLSRLVGPLPGRARAVRRTVSDHARRYSARAGAAVAGR